MNMEERSHTGVDRFKGFGFSSLFSNGAGHRACSRVIALLAFLALLLASCTQASGQIALERSDMDLSVRPGDDFFRYANGGWLDGVEIPDDLSSYSLKEIGAKNRDREIRAILEEAAQTESAEQGSALQKIGDFYATAADTAAIDAAGIAPLAEELDLVDRIATIADVQRFITRLHAMRMDPLFNGFVRKDLKDSSVYKFYLFQGGLGLPDRDYYVKEDERADRIRGEYEKHLTTMFGLLGEKQDQAARSARMVMRLETRLAENSKTRTAMRNMGALYNEMTIEELQELSAGFDWSRFFSDVTDRSIDRVDVIDPIDFIDPIDTVIVSSPAFFEEMGALMKEAPVEEWRAYLRWYLANSFAEFLSFDFIEQDFKFFKALLSGKKEMQDRRERAVQITSALLDDLVGQLYVAKHFSPESKEQVLALFHNLKQTLRQRIRKIEWMSDATREKALDKLEAMKVKIGYPDKWDDFSDLQIRRDSYIANLKRVGRFLYRKNLSLLGKPVDPDTWPLPPQMANAGYVPQRNEVFFPAGMLQPPYFRPDADDAVNYGTVGFGIAHEMLHGFDDNGRNFDKDGNYKNWWTPGDAEEFKKRTRRLVEQYSEFETADGTQINGELTLGENIADFGGLTLAFNAYKNSLNGKTPAPIDGFAHEQRFFLAFAQLFRGKIRAEALDRKIREDRHPWGEFRVNGAPFNVPEFYATFDIEPGDRLFRSEEERPVIW